MTRITRRAFLGCAAATAGSLALPASSLARILGSNEDLRVACVGIRSRGKNHIDGFANLPGVRVTALCDVDGEILAQRASECAERGMKVTQYRDFRRLLEDKDVDAVSIATPNHWHALMTIWAVQAGKDVYVEKPVSHNVREGRMAVLAARKHRRIVAAGTQSRSNPGMREAIRWVREGNLGAIRLARGLCYKPRQSIGKVSGPQVTPEHIDYDLWLGPAAKEPLRRGRLHYDWHWVSSTGNGDLGNQGIHQMDICRWAIGESTLSHAVRSVGARLGYVDDGNTPNTQYVFHEYPDSAPILFEVRGLPRDRASQADGWNKNMDRYDGVGIGVVLHCEGGNLIVPSYASARAVDSDGKEIRKFSGSANHYANFVDAVRTRNAGQLTADIEEGHISSALCHTGLISHALGTERSPAEIHQAVSSSPAEEECIGRMFQHLRANGVDLDKDRLVLGPRLVTDPRNEDFPGAPEANALLERKYREPFTATKRS